MSRADSGRAKGRLRESARARQGVERRGVGWLNRGAAGDGRGACVEAARARIVASSGQSGFVLPPSWEESPPTATSLRPFDAPVGHHFQATPPSLPSLSISLAAMAPPKDSRALPPKEEALFRQVLVRPGHALTRLQTRRSSLKEARADRLLSLRRSNNTRPRTLRR